MDANQIKQTIGQIERSIEDASRVLTEEEFSAYCDSAHKLISTWKKKLLSPYSDYILKSNKN